jgi:hypothetical protein
MVFPPKSILPRPIAANKSAGMGFVPRMGFLVAVELSTSMIGHFASIYATDKVPRSAGPVSFDK